MAIFMTYGDIKGQSSATGQAEKFDIDSVEWGISRGINNRVGTNKDREAQSAAFTEVTVVREVDRASVEIFKEACVGNGKPVTFVWTKTGTDEQDSYLEVNLENCMISNYSQSSRDVGDSQPSRPIETFTISYTRMEIVHKTYDDDNNFTEQHAHAYDSDLGHMTA